jgi:hypothetical protein
LKDQVKGDTNTPRAKLTKDVLDSMSSYTEGKFWFAGEDGKGARKVTTASPDQISRETKLFAAFGITCSKLWDTCEADVDLKSDPRWLNLKGMWPKAMIFTETSPGKPAASFSMHGDWSYITFFIDNTVNYAEVPGIPHNVGAWNSILAHELAHSSGGAKSHGSEWRSAWMFFSRIFTEKLDVPVRMSCGECMMYGVCDKVLCPKCTWINPPSGTESYCGCNEPELGFGDDVVWKSID